MSTLLPPAGRLVRKLVRWFPVGLVTLFAYLPAHAQPTVNGLFYGDGDDLNYSAIAVSPAGRGILYAAVSNGTYYGLILVDTTANDNVFGDCANNGTGADCAYMQSVNWEKNHSYKHLWNSEYTQWELSCGNDSWRWEQGYMVGATCDRDDDPATCAGQWYSPVNSGSPPAGLIQSTSLVHNMNAYDGVKWDATVGGTRTDGDSYRSDDSLDDYPEYSSALDYEWAMVYEFSVPIPAECSDQVIDLHVLASHHSPDKDGGGDIIIIPDPFDFGDNPDSYGTLEASNGAKHKIDLQSVLLGSIVDAEEDGQPSVGSDADDLVTSDDEDGVNINNGTGQCAIGQSFDIEVSYTSSDTDILIDGFIDWNGDGDYGDSGEKVIEANLYNADNSDGLDGTATFSIACDPDGVEPGENVYARFRAHEGVSPLGPTGAVDNGEVEDYVITLQLGIIGDRVWHDLNLDGVQDPGEPGLNNVPVRLIEDNGIDLPFVVATDTTEGDGNYLFENLIAANYIVDVDESVLQPMGLYSTTMNDPFVKPLADGEVDLTIDFGYGATIGNAGDLVWYDADSNGVQNDVNGPLSSEFGLPFVNLELFPGPCPSDYNDLATVDSLASDTTDSFGNYLFTDLTPGTYCILVDVASAEQAINLYVTSKRAAVQAPTTSRMSQGDVPGGGSNLDFDFGFVAGGTVILPVELSSFGAVTSGTGAVLTWTTASEFNNSGFEVEHARGADGEFSPIGFVDGFGTTDTPQSYRFIVPDLGFGLHRFRLRQVDFDGAFDYSSVVEATVTNVPGTFVLEDVYPNPFNPTATVTFGVKVEVPVEITLFDALGRQVKTLYRGTPAEGALNKVSIDGSDLPSGLYHVVMRGGAFSQVKSVTLLK